MMVVTDLDGTLAGKNGELSEASIETLRTLGALGITRVVATGRSAFGAKKILPAGFPIDYLIFSSGAGVLDWRTGELLRSHNLAEEAIEKTAEYLIGRGLDFMLHLPIPGNHEFLYYATGRPNLDFVRRIERNAAFCKPWDAPPAGASQFLVIEPAPYSSVLHEELCRALPSLNVIRATSPLDHASSWLEIFSRSVSKALAGEWLAQRLGVAKANVCAIGNDFNDLDMLRWAGCPFVVGNSPPDLLALFPAVASHDAGGFTEAVERWIKQSSKTHR